MKTNGEKRKLIGNCLENRIKYILSFNFSIFLFENPVNFNILKKERYFNSSLFFMQKNG